MTKQQEIDLLNSTVDKLGKDSYSGEWLSEQLPCILWGIQSDIGPLASGALSIQDAKRKAEQIIIDAQIKAGKIQDDMDKKDKEFNRRLAEAHNRLAKLEDVIKTAKIEISRI